MAVIDMITKHFSYNLLFLLVIVGACRQKPEGDYGARMVLDVEQAVIVEELSTIAKVEAVRLSDDVIFSDVSKMLILSGRQFAILDTRGRILLFDQNGQSVTGPSRGRASNEYNAALDIAYNGTELIVLEENTVKYFDLAQAVDTRSIGIGTEHIYDAIAPRGTGLYLFSAFAKNYRENAKTRDDLLFLLDDKGKVVSSEIQRQDCTFSMFNISQSIDNTYYLRPQNGANVFYKLDADEITPQYQLLLGKKAIPARYYYDEAGEDLRAYMMSDYYKLPMDCHETDCHVFFHFAGEGASDYNVIFNLQTGEGRLWKNSFGSNVRILSSDSEGFYLMADGGTIASLAGSGPLGQLIFDYFSSKSTSVDGLYLVKVNFTF